MSRFALAMSISIEDALRQTLDDHRLSRGEKQALTKLFSESSTANNVIRAKAFDLAREAVAVSKGDDRLVIDWLEGVVKAIDGASDDGDVGFASRAYFSPGDTCVNCICLLFRSIKTSADVCVFTITDNRIRDEVVEAHLRGIKVRVISDDDKSEDRGSDIDYLIEAGIDVVVDRTEAHMHHKFAIFDRKVLLSGSYNWTRSAATSNQENIALTEDTKLLREFQGEFDRLWKQLS
ncbi:MAG: cardiolipin hydrolase [Verrucomicrobiales bacterium]|jgi:cardiolipin hydrolase